MTKRARVARVARVVIPSTRRGGGRDFCKARADDHHVGRVEEITVTTGRRGYNTVGLPV